MIDSTNTTRSGAGREGEDRAAAFLADQGFQIMARNYRGGRLAEIDIVARRGSLVVFVEVKRRESGAFGGGIYAVSAGKKRRLRMAAQHFLRGRCDLESADTVFRFDLITVGGGSVEWIEDIVR